MFAVVPEVSAGVVVYRRGPGGVEVLLAHPGGPFFRKRDAGAWTIPKGLVGQGEEPIDAARRELAEETGLEPPAAGALVPLGSVKQKGGKVVHAWGLERDCDPEALFSNDFELEWPPRTGKLQRFPELDRFAFFDRRTALEKILPAQAPLLDRLFDGVL